MRNFLLFVFAILLMTSCHRTKTDKQLEIDENRVKEFIQDKNKENIGVEDRQIDDYLLRRKWNFERTKSGLRYLIYAQGQGVNPIPGDVITLEYSLSLIRGDLIYSSKDLGPLVFTVDREDVPSGLNEFVKMMRLGDKAKLIVPSYLGYGVIGDDHKVPPRATLFYDLQLTRISR